MKLKKTIASTLQVIHEKWFQEMIDGPPLVCANSGGIGFKTDVDAGAIINCVLIACYFSDASGNDRRLNLVHVNGKSLSLYPQFNIQTHPFNSETVPDASLTLPMALADIPGLTCRYIDVIGGNRETDKTLVGKIIEIIAETRPKIDLNYTRVTKDGYFNAVIRPDGDNSYTPFDSSHNVITTHFNTSNLQAQP